MRGGYNSEGGGHVQLDRENKVTGRGKKRGQREREEGKLEEWMGARKGERNGRKERLHGR